eukprot:TRINITY_DN6744_c0_g1_i3.p1 TRINITY_DN6744_c0_g1~~TRINITY_DN6744_c0_g1_i3.p1  ORF type:complete len:725 (+),score=149.93 TRINITY_DN6744_c0_g1_i3:52-2226(+)
MSVVTPSTPPITTPPRRILQRGIPSPRSKLQRSPHTSQNSLSEDKSKVHSEAQSQIPIQTHHVVHNSNTSDLSPSHAKSNQNPISLSNGNSTPNAHSNSTTNPAVSLLSFPQEEASEYDTWIDSLRPPTVNTPRNRLQQKLTAKSTSVSSPSSVFRRRPQSTPSKPQDKQESKPEFAKTMSPKSKVPQIDLDKLMDSPYITPISRISGKRSHAPDQYLAKSLLLWNSRSISARALLESSPSCDFLSPSPQQQKCFYGDPHLKPMTADKQSSRGNESASSSARNTPQLVSTNPPHTPENGCVTLPPIVSSPSLRRSTITANMHGNTNGGLSSRKVSIMDPDGSSTERHLLSSRNGDSHLESSHPDTLNGLSSNTTKTPRQPLSDKTRKIMTATGEEASLPSERDVQECVLAMFHHLDPEKYSYVWYDDLKTIICSLENSSKFGLHCTSQQAQQLLDHVQSDGLGVVYYEELVYTFTHAFMRFQVENASIPDISHGSSTFATDQEGQGSLFENAADGKSQNLEDQSIADQFLLTSSLSSDIHRVHGYSKKHFHEKLLRSCISIDYESCGKMDRVWFRKALSQAGMGLSQREISHLISQAPVDESNKVDYRLYSSDCFDTLQAFMHKRYQQLASDVHFTRHILLKAFQDHIEQKLHSIEENPEFTSLFTVPEIRVLAKESSFLVLHNEARTNKSNKLPEIFFVYQFILLFQPLGQSSLNLVHSLVMI